MNIPVISQANYSIVTEEIPLPYWYTYEALTITPNDIWVPFWALSDVPYSLPLRGYNQESRNQFLDFGAVEWLNTWAEDVYSWPGSEYGKELLENETLAQLEFLFETMTARLAKPPSYVDEARGFIALDYVKEFEPPYQGFLPLIVMYGLNDTYDNSNMDEWAIHPDIINSSINEAFPLVDWETELFWFDYDNATEFADLMAEKTSGDYIIVDDDYLTRCDEIIYNIVSSDPRCSEYDLVFPSLILIQEYGLYAVQYEAPVGGLGRLPSAYPDIDTWGLNGRGLFSWFYAGNPDTPRRSITTTIIHELGHCIGQTDIHSEFGWALAASTSSLMSAYCKTSIFDKLDRDLILNAQVLQLWGRYLDEISYFEDFSLNQTQQETLSDLDTSLSEIPDLLISGDVDAIKSLLYTADDVCEQLASDLAISRKSDNWSERSPVLDVQVDWIIGPGIPNAVGLVAELSELIGFQRELITFVNTTLPVPQYELNISISVTDDLYNTAITNAFRRSLVEANTSYYDPELVPEDAWSTWPRNRLFQNVSGYAIEGLVAEQWLTDNPYTMNNADRLHYRFYIFNLENMTLNLDFTTSSSQISETTTSSTTTSSVSYTTPFSTTTPTDLSLILAVGGVATVVIVSMVVYLKIKKTKGFTSS